MPKWVKKTRSQHPSLPEGGYRGLMWLVILLVGLQPGVFSCQHRAGLFPGQQLGQVRPASNTARLVQNAAYLKHSGRVELAVKELEEAHLQEPGNLTILDALIQCYEALGDFERALELYDQALARAGQHPALENNRCYSLYLAGRLNKAENCFREVLARQPDNQKVRNNLGLVLCRQGREAEALTMWQETLAEDASRQRLSEALAALGREAPASLASHPVVTKSQTSTASVTQKAGAVIQPDQPSRTAAPSFELRQPPVVPARAAAAFGQWARRAPHPSAETEPGTEPSPRKPAPISAPTEQMPVIEATPVKRPVPQHTAVPSSPPVADYGRGRSVDPRERTWLTSQELITTRIEVKNGNGCQNLARETRSLLWGEGFTVVAIGNHMDFGMERTVIIYRPDATRVAQTLARRYFPNATLQPGGRLTANADVRIILGQNLLPEKDSLAKLVY